MRMKGNNEAPLESEDSEKGEFPTRLTTCPKTGRSKPCPLSLRK
jgi:hypothetical protein